MQSKSKFLFRLLNVKNERENKIFSQILRHRIEKKLMFMKYLAPDESFTIFYQTNDKYVYFFLLSRKYTELLIFRGGNLD